MPWMFAIVIGLFLALALMAQAAPSSQPTTQPGVPDARFAHLAKGINLSHWYAQAIKGSYDQKWLSTYITADDAQNIARMGFTHVRLTLNDTVVFDGHGGIKADNVGQLKIRMQWFLDQHLAVIVDLHPDDDFKKGIHDDPAKAQAMVDSWGKLAGAMAGFDPDWVFFEILNEPEPNKGQAWHDLQGRCLAAIRAAAPRHTIIVNPGAWSGVHTIKDFAAYDDPNVIYTLHWYEPLFFTHQGAGWAPKTVHSVKDLHWPIDPSQAEAAAKAATDNPDSIKDLQWNIAHGQFTEAWTKQQLDVASDWSKAHGNARIYLGEFGAYRKNVPVDDRLRWTEFVRKQFEARGWGWAMWDYAGGFAVVNEFNKVRLPDEDLLKSLGLK